MRDGRTGSLLAVRWALLLACGGACATPQQQVRITNSTPYDNPVEIAAFTVSVVNGCPRTAPADVKNCRAPGGGYFDDCTAVHRKRPRTAAAAAGDEPGAITVKAGGPGGALDPQSLRVIFDPGGKAYTPDAQGVITIPIDPSVPFGPYKFTVFSTAGTCRCDDPSSPACVKPVDPNVIIMP